MSEQLFVDVDGSGAEPQPGLLQDVCQNTFQYAGELTASAIVMNGACPNMFAPWGNAYFIGGTEKALATIPIAIEGRCMHWKNICQCKNLYRANYYYDIKKKQQLFKRKVVVFCFFFIS